MNIHVIQHAKYEGPGHIIQWAEDRNISLNVVSMYKRQPLPDPAYGDGIIFLGGPMNVYDNHRYSWLNREKKFLNSAIAYKKPIVGICLGAQMLANALGGRVFENEKKEIGWFPVRFSNTMSQFDFMEREEKELVAFHWHQETFDLPMKSDLLAESDACKNQAFIANDCWLGLQFHLETTRQNLQEMIRNGKDQLDDGENEFVQTEEELLNVSDETYDKMHALLYKMLDYIFKVNREEE